jgi:peptide/nickel transport system permease protein
LKGKRAISCWIVLLVALHAIVILAGFFAPYDPTEQDRKSPYLPPMRIHFVDAEGHFHVRPFAYALQLREGTFDQYEENVACALQLKLFMRGARYKLLGFVPMRLHLFGVEGERIYLLGSDSYGRDQLSRFLYGGQVSLFAGLLGAGITLILGLCFGALAGFYGGWRDDLLMRLAELFLALPWLYLLFALRAFLPLAVSPLQAFFLIIVVLGAVGWALRADICYAAIFFQRRRAYCLRRRRFWCRNSYLRR